MSTLTETLVTKIATLPEGTVFYPKELLHLGSRAAIDQTLSRLCRRGQVTRVARGAYVKPISGRFGVRPPTPEKMLNSLAEKTGETLVTHGAAAANALGLTTQVPVHEIFLTSGRSRKFTLGARVLELRHAPYWQIALGNRPAGAAIRALAWLGPQQAPPKLTELHKKLPQKEWNVLMARRATFPSWMAKALGETTRAVSRV